MLRIILLISACLFAPACKAESAAGAEPYRIGAILPLTGPLASLGAGSKKGIEMAVAALNASGGISGRPIEVIYQDSLGDPKTGLAAFNAMHPALNVPVVISGLTSVSQALKKVADRQKVIVFAESSLEGILDDSTYMMRNFTDSSTFYGGWRRYLTSRGMRKVAVIRAEEEWAQGAMKALTASSDLEVVEEVSIPATTVDIKTNIARLRGLGRKFDALLLVLLGSAQAVAINQLSQTPIEVPLFTAYLCSQPTLADVVKGRYNGHITFEGARDSRQAAYGEFLTKFRTRYGQSEPEFSALSQYDTVMMVAESLKAGARSADEIKAFITNRNGFKGLLGVTRFDAKGSAVHPAIPMRYQDGVCTEVDHRAM